MSHQPLNIHAGTQIVTKVGVHGSNNALVHPLGAVGIVTRTPCGSEKHYLVRFPDGFEASMLMEELEVLKHFKDRLDPAGARDFDLEDHVIYRCIVGSRAYGLETETSDTDLRGIYLAPAELQWSLYGAPEQFEDNATQSCYWELQKFLVMALKANPNILECLYSPLVDKVTPIGSELLAIRDRFLSQMIFQTFNGYALSQFKKIEQDLRNHGEVRWKHAMHLLRLLMTGTATLREGRVPVHVGDRRDQLLAVKRGELSWEKVDAWRQDLHRDFEQALAETKLPERPDYEAANELLITSRKCSREPEPRFLYHCFPRPSMKADGIKVLRSIFEHGLVLAPEKIKFGTTDHIQTRICFTDLSPGELFRHSLDFGGFALEFDHDSLRTLGAIPAFYSPQTRESNDLSSSAMELATTLKEIEQALIANKITEANHDESDKLSRHHFAIEAVLNLLYPTDNLHKSGTEPSSLSNKKGQTLLKYYRQREWKIIYSFARIENGKPVWDFQISTPTQCRMLEDLNPFFAKPVSEEPNLIRSERCFFFKEMGTRRVIDFIRRIIVPHDELESAKQLAAKYNLQCPVVVLEEL